MPRANDITTPIHPGEILLAEFLQPLGLSQYRLAKELNVPQIRISQIVRGRRAITADTAMRLARYFGNSVEFWMGLQTHYDLDCAEEASAAIIARDITPRAKRSA